MKPAIHEMKSGLYGMSCTIIILHKHALHNPLQVVSVAEHVAISSSSN